MTQSRDKTSPVAPELPPPPKKAPPAVAPEQKVSLEPSRQVALEYGAKPDIQIVDGAKFNAEREQAEKDGRLTRAQGDTTHEVRVLPAVVTEHIHRTVIEVVHPVVHVFDDAPSVDQENNHEQGTATASILESWNSTDTLDEPEPSAAKPVILEIINKNQSPAPTSSVTATPAFTAPIPHPTDPKKIILRNPWDNDVVILDAEKEKREAAEFFAKHVTNLAPFRPPFVSPSSQDRKALPIGGRRSSKDLVPAPSTILAAGDTELEKAKGGFAFTPLVPPLVNLIGTTEQEPPKATAVIAKKGNNLQQSGGTISKAASKPSQSVAPSSFAQEMLALFDSAFSGAPGAAPDPGQNPEGVLNAGRARAPQQLVPQLPPKDALHIQPTAKQGDIIKELHEGPVPPMKVAPLGNNIPTQASSANQPTPVQSTVVTSANPTSPPGVTKQTVPASLSKAAGAQISQAISGDRTRPTEGQLAQSALTSVSTKTSAASPVQPQSPGQKPANFAISIPPPARAAPKPPTAQPTIKPTEQISTLAPPPSTVPPNSPPRRESLNPPVLSELSNEQERQISNVTTAAIQHQTLVERRDPVAIPTTSIQPKALATQRISLACASLDAIAAEAMEMATDPDAIPPVTTHITKPQADSPQNLHAALSTHLTSAIQSRLASQPQTATKTPKMTTVTPMVLSAKRVQPVPTSAGAGGTYVVGSGKSGGADIPKGESRENLIGQKDSDNGEAGLKKGEEPRAIVR